MSVYLLPQEKEKNNHNEISVEQYVVDFGQTSERNGNVSCEVSHNDAQHLAVENSVSENEKDEKGTYSDPFSIISEKLKVMKERLKAEIPLNSEIQFRKEFDKN